MSNKVSKFVSVLVSLIFYFSFIIGGLLVIMYRGDDTVLNYINETVSEVAHRDLSINKNAGEDFITIQNDSTDADFKILQLTDLHISASMLSVTRDKLAVDAVYDAVKSCEPDFIIVTGDLVYPNLFRSLSVNNLNMAKIVGTLFEKMGVPWTFVYGNHDAESYAVGTKNELSDLFMSYDTCIFKKGLSNVDGQGNYVIELHNYDGTLSAGLVLMDSNSYVDNGDYDFIHENQMAWYETAVTALKARNSLESVETMVFCHIPLTEYTDAWDAVETLGLEAGESGTTAEDIDVKYFWGTKGEKTCSSYDQITTIFDTFKTNGTVAVFCGHDHVNNYSIMYDGIRLTYGMSIDYTAYFNIDKTTAQRGATLLTLKSDSSYTIQQMPQDNNWQVVTLQI